MAFIHGKSAGVMHGVFNLSSFLNDVSVAQDVEAAETTTFGGSAKSYIVGLRDATVSASGMFDGSAAAVDEVLTSAIGSDTLAPLILAPSGLTGGTRAYILQAKTTSYEVSSPVADVVSVSFDVQADGGADASVLLVDLAAITATGNGTSRDNGASTTNGGMAQLHVSANTLNGAIAFKVAHSADNSTFADLVSFTSVPATNTTSERVVSAPLTTVNRYLRAKYTTTGSGSITFIMAFARR